MRHLCLLCVVWWMVAAAVLPANGAGLEDIAEGEFRATGIVRQTPGDDEERMFCRMANTARPDAIVINGRCATATASRGLRVDIKVLEPRRRYSLTSTVRTRTKGIERETLFVGRTRGSRVEFSADVRIDGSPYRSRFVIHLHNDRISRIIETVTPRNGGGRTTLIDVSVKRQ